MASSDASFFGAVPFLDKVKTIAVTEALIFGRITLGRQRRPQQSPLAPMRLVDRGFRMKTGSGHSREVHPCFIACPMIFSSNTVQCVAQISHRAKLRLDHAEAVLRAHDVKLDY